MTTELKEKETQEITKHERVRVYRPRVNIMQRSEDVVLEADMPGVDEKTVEITVERNVLTIHGRPQYVSREGYTLVHGEYGYGNYERSFTISDEIDRDHIQATVKNGVLRLVLPKAEKAKPRKVTITGA